MTTYYTKKKQVKLEPGQTLGYTPGRGYYAKGTPASSTASTAGVTSAGQPTPQGGTAGGTTAPTSSAGTLSPARAAVQPVAAAPTKGEATSADATSYYSDPSEIVPKPGETIAYTPGKGYYLVPVKTDVIPPASTKTTTRVAVFGLAGGFGDWRLYQDCCTLDGTRALITTPASSTSWSMTVQEACVAARSAAEDPDGNQLTVAYAQCFNGGEVDMNAACGANGDLFNLVEQLNGSTGNAVCTNVGNPGFNTTHKYTVDTTDPSGNNWLAYIDGTSTNIALTFSRHNAAVVGEGDENTGTCGIGTFTASSDYSTMQRWNGSSWITVQGADWEPSCSWTKNDGPPDPWTVSH